MLIFKLAWRSVWRHKWRSGITMFAIGSALFLIIFTTALGDGMYNQMIRDAVRMSTGHLVLEHSDYRDNPAVDLTVRVPAESVRQLADYQQVETVKAVVTAQGVAKTGRGTVGVAIMGVDAEAERTTSPLATKIVAGEFLNAEDQRKVVIGEKLAERLKTKVGKKVVLASTNKDGEMVEELVRVKGIFRMGSPEVDGHLAQVNIDFARSMFGLQADESNQVGVVLTSDDDRELIRPAMTTLVGETTVLHSWEVVLAELTGYVKVDKASNQIFLGIILVISLFTIFNTILMSVLERSHEFAMMRALGTSASRVRGQVMAESLVIGVCGTLFGILAGWGLSAYLGKVGMDLSDMYGGEIDVSGFAIDVMIYPYISPATLATLSGIVLASVLLVSLWTLRHLSNIEIANTLR